MISQSYTLYLQEFVSHLSAELDEYVKLAIEFQARPIDVASETTNLYPKRCSLCDRLFTSYDDFMKNTAEIPHGISFYPTISDLYYHHRNCKDCDTTLVVRFSDRRDDSENGQRRRELFTICWEFVLKNYEIDRKAARQVILNYINLTLAVSKIHRKPDSIAPKASIVDRFKSFLSK
ncbi:MAG: hypothetical protein EOP06_02690 [Proteobacteria bacterium]|nr:MAG: hypothetical protein EOP06_02690 [Pseudomonadota bacterium]